MGSTAGWFSEKTASEVAREHRSFMEDLYLEAGADVLRAELASTWQEKAAEGDDEAVLREFIDDEMRKEMLRELEYKRAQRLVPLVRAVGTAPPNSPAPGVSLDTEWSGPLGTLSELYRLGLRRDTGRLDRDRVSEYSALTTALSAQWR